MRQGGVWRPDTDTGGVSGGIGGQRCHGRVVASPRLPAALLNLNNDHSSPTHVIMYGDSTNPNFLCHKRFIIFRRHE